MKPLLPERFENPEREHGDDKHRVMLALDREDYEKLRSLVSDANTNNNDVIRKCIRNQYEVNIQHKRNTRGIE